jgi:predicted restriction endonuclease
MKARYSYQCQVCNYRLEFGSFRYAEVHHLRPLGEGGFDNEDNMLVLCPNHHAEFDYGLIGISGSDRSTVINNEGQIIGKLTMKQNHQLRIENIEYQLTRMHKKR